MINTKKKIFSFSYIVNIIEINKKKLIKFKKNIEG